MKNIVLFASGGGSSVENMLRSFINEKQIKVLGIFCNNQKAGLLKRVYLKKFKTIIFKNNDLLNGNVFAQLKRLDPELIVLAGFLKKIPKDIILNYHKRIINIHPSLLPKYGGKNMYGNNVHKAVIENNEKKSGFTIHYVNEEYDQGDIIFQKSIEVDTKNVDELANKILEEEHKYYPIIVKQVLNA
tara:strand:+ start:16161 stop:16721 length:561 start_codon:yes stop_codon:yes gene_type:complete